MKKNATPPEQLGAEAREFRAKFKTLLLATASNDGTPECSYAPYIADNEGSLYVFLSHLARHTSNLLTNPKAGVLFIQEEEKTRNLFARKRISLQCKVIEISRESADGQSILSLMEQNLGKTIGLLQQLPDFHLFKLTFESGDFVRGFGEAYTLANTNLDIDELRKS